MRVGYTAKSGGLIWISFLFFFNMKVCFVFSIELPHRGDSNENTKHTIINIKRKITCSYPKSATMVVLFPGTQKRVRNSHAKQAISVRATEVLLYIQICPVNALYCIFNLPVKL